MGWYLDLLERSWLFLPAIQRKVAFGLTAPRIVLHPQRDRPPGLGPPPNLPNRAPPPFISPGPKVGQTSPPSCVTHLIELEAHEGLDQRALPARLLADDQHGGRIKGLLEVLGGKKTRRRAVIG
jgi:hypothetical protein